MMHVIINTSCTDGVGSKQFCTMYESDSHRQSLVLAFGEAYGERGSASL